MFLKWNKLYIFLLIACLAGYIWIFFVIISGIDNNPDTTVCIIKKITNIPCPSCGSTRAVTYLLKGELINSLYLNPFGLIITIIMIVAPIWIIFDVATSKSTFMDFYRKLEIVVRKKHIAILLILMVLLNWIWNIKKGL